MKLAETARPAATTLPPAHTAFIQRKCACGGGVGESCEECNEKAAVAAPVNGHSFAEIAVTDESQKSQGEGEAEDTGESDLDETAEPQDAPTPAPAPGMRVPVPPPPPAPAAAVKLTTQTVATTPADRARTKIGIGEEVVCSTDPATNATWSVTGGGAVSPASGTSTTFTASKSPSKPTVKATIGAGPLTVAFDVIPPNGVNSSVGSNPGQGTKGPPNNQIGFKTIFDCVVQPDTVSFYNAEFRENIPEDKWTWPDGTADSNGPKVVPWGVNQANQTRDTVSSALRPIGRIKKGGSYVDFAYTIRVPEDYKNEAGTWVTWLASEAHYKEFKGATQEGRATLKATNNSTGSWQGPWQ